MKTADILSPEGRICGYVSLVTSKIVNFLIDSAEQKVSGDGVEYSLNVGSGILQMSFPVMATLGLSNVRCIEEQKSPAKTLATLRRGGMGKRKYIACAELQQRGLGALHKILTDS